MKRLILSCYLVLSIEVAYAQQSLQTPVIKLEEVGKSEGLFYEYFQGNAKLEMKVNKAKRFKMLTGAGKVVVKEGKGSKIYVDAEVLILASNYKKALKYLDRDLKLSLQDHGSYIELLSSFDYGQESRRGDRLNPLDFIKTPDRKVNLTVYVPRNLDLEVYDNSGDLEFSGLTNNLHIDDGSGYIKVRNVNGNLSIDDRSGNIYIGGLNKPGTSHKTVIDDASGSIELNNIYGNLTIQDDSGDIYAEQIVGNINIDDYSGELKIRDIKGDINIDDTSGDITTKGISGNATYSDGAGDIFISEVSQSVNILESGAGDVYIKNVKGTVKGRGRKFDR